MQQKLEFFRKYKAREVNAIVGEYFLSEERCECFSKEEKWQTRPDVTQDDVPPQFAIVKSKQGNKHTAMFTTMASDTGKKVGDLRLGEGLKRLPPKQIALMNECDQILIPLDIRSREHIVLLRIIPSKGNQPAICTLLDPSAKGLFYLLPEGLEASIKKTFGNNTIFNKTVLFQQWEDVNCGVNACCNAIDLMDDPDCTLSRMPTWRIDERLQFEDKLASAATNSRIDRRDQAMAEYANTQLSSEYEKAVPNYLIRFYHRNHVIIKTALFLALIVIPLAFIPGVGPFLATAAGYIGLGGLAAIQLTAITAGLIVGVGILSSCFHEVFNGIANGISQLINHLPPEKPAPIDTFDIREDDQATPTNLDAGEGWTDIPPETPETKPSDKQVGFNGLFATSDLENSQNTKTIDNIQIDEKNDAGTTSLLENNP